MKRFFRSPLDEGGRHDQKTHAPKKFLRGLLGKKEKSERPSGPIKPTARGKGKTRPSPKLGSKADSRAKSTGRTLEKKLGGDWSFSVLRSGGSGGPGKGNQVFLSSKRKSPGTNMKPFTNMAAGGLKRSGFTKGSANKWSKGRTATASINIRKGKDRGGESFQVVEITVTGIGD